MTQYLYEPITAECPLCSSNSANLLYSINSADAAQYYILKEVEADRYNSLLSHIEKLWEGNQADVVVCNSCGFGYAFPYVAGDAKFYGLAYSRNSYPAWKWEHQLSLDVIESIVSNSGQTLRLLEIGAGDGVFLRKVSPALIPAKNVITTEFSDFGAAQIEGSGFVCHRNDIRDLPKSKIGKFDIICLFQVLEHLDRLDVLFTHLNTLCNENAHLFIAVPNPDRVEFNEQHDALLDIPPNHVGRWRKQNFQNIANKYGWNLAGHEIDEEPFSSKVREYLAYRYMHRRQDSASVFNKVEQISNPKMRRALQAIGALTFLPTSLPALLKLQGANLGHHQWVYLTK